MKKIITKSITVITMLAIVLTMAMPMTAQAKTKAKPKLSKTKITLTMTNKKKNPTTTLKVKNANGKKVKWSTNNKKVVTIKKTGKYSIKVVAKKAGRAGITCKVNGKKLTCRVVVKDKRTKKNKSSNSNTNNNNTNNDNSNNSNTNTGNTNSGNTTEETVVTDNCNHVWEVVDERIIVVPFDTKLIDSLIASGDMFENGSKINIRECPGCGVIYTDAWSETACDYICHDKAIHSYVTKNYTRAQLAAKKMFRYTCQQCVHCNAYKDLTTDAVYTNCKVYQ